MKALRIAILAHSTNPRGGVVHALELGDALTRMGHEAVVHAPDAKNTGFFRPTLCETVSVPASPIGADVAEMVEIRAADYVRHFENPANRRFDVFHAQDGISGNALASLKTRGLISGFARTVHHVDDFADPRLQVLQKRSIVEADQHFVVSRLWQGLLAEQFGLTATIVGNGVDTARFTPTPNGREDALRARLGLGSGPIILSVGGVEPRKNCTRLLESCTQLHSLHQRAQLVIAGGASVLNHDGYQAEFAQALRASDLPSNFVIQTGPLPQEDMPALFRIADVLAFPSIKEGFGLVVLEAMASGLPCVVSRIAPFTEHLREEDVVWCNPSNVGSIANALTMALNPELRSRLIRAGHAAAQRHGWQATALAHIDIYQSLREQLNA